MLKSVKFFLKDQIGLICMYSFSVTIIISYFKIHNQDQVDLFYPIVLAVFPLVSYLGIKFYYNQRFIRYLKQIIQYHLIQHHPANHLEAQIVTSFETILGTHLSKEAELKTHYQERNYLFSQWFHNMKTPLTVLNLLLEQEQLSLKEMKSELVKLQHNVEQAIHLLRLDQFEQDFDLIEFNLVSALKDVINQRKNEFILSGLYPKLEVVEELVLVVSDLKWCQFILQQIISNAIKYRQKHSKSVYFKIKTDGEKVVLKIQDEGCGIPAYDLNRVFEPFFTGENGRKQDQSTGIGLFMVKKIAKHLRINISIESEVNIGTEVTLEFLSKL